MSWSDDVIEMRRATKGRGRQFADVEVLSEMIESPEFRDLVNTVAAVTPKYRLGRPRQHSPVVLALLMLTNIRLKSQKRAELFLATPLHWNYFLGKLQRLFPDDPLLLGDVKPPTRSILRHAKKRNTMDSAWCYYEVLENQAATTCELTGAGINTGTLLEPSINAILYGDAVTFKPPSSYTPGDDAFNKKTGERQMRRHDPDADTARTGDNKVVWGNTFDHMSAFTGHPGEHITLGFRPVSKSGDDSEANVAIEIAADIKAAMPGFAAVTYDKAVRGVRIHELWDLELQPLIGVYDKSGLSTEIVPLRVKNIAGIDIHVYAFEGAVCIQGSRGQMIKLDPIKLEYHRNADDTRRAYGKYLIPEGSDCDTRLWGKTFLQRLNALMKDGRAYGEYVRAIPPRSDRWNALYGTRSLAESYNSWMKAQLLPEQRARSYGVVNQWIDFTLMAMIRNTETQMRYRLRTHGSLDRAA